MWLGRSVAPRNVPVVSTGSFSLDIALGIGGLPKVSCVGLPPITPSTLHSESIVLLYALYCALP